MTLGGVTISSLSSTGSQDGAESLLLDIDAQLHVCPIDYPGHRIHYLTMESTRRVSSSPK